ncbi:MFS transporter [Escherichia coli]
MRLFWRAARLLRKLFYIHSGDASWLNTDGWRYMFASECIPALLFLMLLYTVPESPRWLMSRGKQDQAKYPAQNYGQHVSTQAVQEIEHFLDHGRKTGGRLLMFGVGVIVIGVMLSIFQRFVGINVVLPTRRKCSKRWGPARISRCCRPLYQELSTSPLPYWQL